MKVVLPEAEKAGAKKVLSISLCVGEMAGVVSDCVEEYLNILGKDTMLEGAKVIAKTLPVKAECHSCGYEGPIDRKDIRCPVCGSKDMKAVGGWEYYVDSIEVE